MSENDNTMFITAGLLNMLLKHFGTSESDIHRLFTASGLDATVLQNPITKVDAHLLGAYLEHIVKKNKNHRTGLETGFLLPFTMTGNIFNIYNRSKTVREIFENAEPFEPTANNILIYTTREENNLFYFEIAIEPEFARLYPVGARQWVEMQYGISLQYAYSFTGRYLHPVLACSMYKKEGAADKLEEYLGCPVKYEVDKLAMIFNKSVLDLPVITGNKDLLPIFEDYMHEIRLLEEQPQNRLSRSVRRYLMHGLINANLDLAFVAEKFNMSGRTIQRKLKAEGTSYQQILDALRIELSQKYLKEKIPLAEISFLLGFETQSAFNKFFKKHFHSPPTRFV